LKRMDEVHEPKEVIIENYEKHKIFFEQVR